MIAKQVELHKAAYSVEDFPRWDMPELSFIGRSNVGKSSLLNSLVGKKNLARISSTPGKTRGLYFYLVNNKFSFVDLPGYGYARVSKMERQSWAQIIEGYLENRGNLFGCFHLVDCRHEPSHEDKIMSDWLRVNSIPRITVVTKSDKLSKGALQRQIKIIRKELDLFSDDALIPFSVKSKAGNKDLWKAVFDLLPNI